MRFLPRGSIPRKHLIVLILLLNVSVFLTFYYSAQKVQTSTIVQLMFTCFVPDCSVFRCSYHVRLCDSLNLLTERFEMPVYYYYYYYILSFELWALYLL